MKVKIFSFESCFRYVFWNMYDSKSKFALISIQSPDKNDGVLFTKTDNCKDVLTLYFEDVVEEDIYGMENLIIFNNSHADEILRFINDNTEVDYFIIHCHAGVSRSSAIGKFILEYFNEDSKWIDESKIKDEVNGNVINKYYPNQLVYKTLKLQEKNNGKWLNK